MTVYSGPVFDMAMAIGVEKVRAAKTTRGLFP